LWPLKWLPDGMILALDDHERITVIDPSSVRRTRTFDVKGDVADVSDDLQYVAPGRRRQLGDPADSN
jgi:hypothetical protein